MIPLNGIFNKKHGHNQRFASRREKVQNRKLPDVSGNSRATVISAKTNKQKSMRISFPIILFFLILFIFVFQSCGHKSKTAGNGTFTEDTIYRVHADMKNEVDEMDEDEIENETYEEDIVYPETGKTVDDFIPNNYEVQYETNGDLNNDALSDIVIVLKQKDSNTEKRPMLILLQDNDKTYRLDKVSNFVMPIEYDEADFKVYHSEEIGIDNENLYIHLYGSNGGSFFCSFQYFENELLLTYIEAFGMGAGSQTELYYDLTENELTKITTNTSEEDMPPESQTIKTEKKKHIFEDVSPHSVMNETFEKYFGK